MSKNSHGKTASKAVYELGKDVLRAAEMLDCYESLDWEVVGVARDGLREDELYVASSLHRDFVRAIRRALERYDESSEKESGDAFYVHFIPKPSPDESLVDLVRSLFKSGSHTPESIASHIQAFFDAKAKNHGAE